MDDHLKARPWPPWGPPTTSTFTSATGLTCLVCSASAPNCVCNPKVTGWISRASQGDATLKHMMYEDKLLERKFPWLRVTLRDDGQQKLLFATCWLCSNFLEKKGGRQMLGDDRKGLYVGSIQIGQFRDHVLTRDGKPAVAHGAALERYNRQCAQWRQDYWNEELSLGESGTVKASMDKLRAMVDEQMANHCRQVYTAIFLKESTREYMTRVELAKLHKGNYYGDLYANEAFFQKCQHALSCRLFERVWQKLMDTPVIVICSDEADSYMGIRVQYLQVDHDHTKPASEFFQLRLLHDFRAETITTQLKNAFLNPGTQFGYASGCPQAFGDDAPSIRSEAQRFRCRRRLRQRACCQ